MNSMQLKEKVRKISKKKNVDFNTILRLYMYDRFIERLSVSKYKDNFILKGGFYLSTLFGVEKRMTMDIDTAVTLIKFKEENIRTMIEEIVKIDIFDEAELKLINITKIKDKDEYGGYRATINVKLENIRETFQLDIATGDPITPQAIIYKYLSTLEDKNIDLWAYNIETVIAEKIETILSRGEANSRMRDYYDIYLIYKTKWKSIDKDILVKAIRNTFKKRKFNSNIYNNLKIIKNSQVLKSRWIQYSIKNEYAKNITYDEILGFIEKIIETMELTYI